MRTTVTLEPGVAERLEALAHRRQASFEDTLDDVLRRGLAARERAQQALRFAVGRYAGGFRLGIEHQAELDSNDADFGRFPGPRWRNLLAWPGRAAPRPPVPLRSPGALARAGGARRPAD